ncbi:MAG: hypothetical protein ACK46Q_01640 [Hyphomonas sp.]
MITDARTRTSADGAYSGSQTNSLGKEIENKTSDIAHSVEKTAHAAVEKGQEIAEMAGDKAQKAHHMLATRIKDHPMSSIGAAFGVGVIFALLRR